MAQLVYKKGSKSPFLLRGDDEKFTFFIYCSVCRFGLCKVMSVIRADNGDNIMLVDPCPVCMENLRTGKNDKGYPPSSIERRISRKDLDDVMGS